MKLNRKYQTADSFQNEQKNNYTSSKSCLELLLPSDSWWRWWWWWWRWRKRRLGFKLHEIPVFSHCCRCWSCWCTISMKANMMLDHLQLCCQKKTAAALVQPQPQRCIPTTNKLWNGHRSILNMSPEMLFWTAWEGNDTVWHLANIIFSSQHVLLQMGAMVSLLQERIGAEMTVKSPSEFWLVLLLLSSWKKAKQ